MNKTAERIAVMQAALEEKAIQVATTGTAKRTWTDISDPNWNWAYYDYRVKPPEPPKPKEFYANEYSYGLSVYETKERAVSVATPNVIRKGVLYREVVCECDEKDWSY